MVESELLSIGIFLVKVILKIGQVKHLLSILFWKLILGFIKIKALNGKKLEEVFVKKNCCGVYHKWFIIQNQTVK